MPKKLLCVFTCVIMLMLTACQSSNVLIPAPSHSVTDQTVDSFEEIPAASADQAPATVDQLPASADQAAATPDQIPATPDGAPATPDQTPEAPSPTVSAQAVPDKKIRLYDEIKLLTDAENTTISTSLDYFSNKRKMDLAVMTVNTTAGADVLKYAQFIYDRRDYGYGDTNDGMILMIAMKDRQIAIGTYGKCERLYPDAAVKLMLDEIGPLLTEEDYFGAINRYIELADERYANKAPADIVG